MFMTYGGKEKQGSFHNRILMESIPEEGSKLSEASTRNNSALAKVKEFWYSVYCLNYFALSKVFERFKLF